MRFPSEIVLEGSTSGIKTVWFNTRHGEVPSDAADAAWAWFQDVLVMAAKDLRAPELTGFPDGFGPLTRHSDGSATMEESMKGAFSSRCSGSPSPMGPASTLIRFVIGTRGAVQQCQPDGSVGTVSRLTE